ncbi:hydrogenase [Deferribacteraceae bacterium V6Fe1]|nr:hydrogenase [Deferribacteraceae bacterium V6Fe1]
MVKIKQNPAIINLENLPFLASDDFLEKIISSVENSGRIASYFVYKHRDKLNAVAIIMFDEKKEFEVFAAKVNKKLNSITPKIPQIYNFEREIFEQYPDAINGDKLKPLRFHKPFEGKRQNYDIGDMEFYEIDSHETHQVGVGPVHAGIIEPGHFRFNCYGEKVLSLEISLGYQHRGIEKSLIGGPYKDSFYKIQTASGDSTIAHTICYLANLENLSGIDTETDSKLKRMAALELERIANHVGDLGGLATDIGFLPTASYCGRIRGDFLNMTADLCGNRFGRSMLEFGGEKVEKSLFEKIIKKIEATRPNLLGAIEMLWNTPSVMSRFDNTGVLPKKIAMEMGIVGLHRRASGINNDIRKDFPFLLYDKYFKEIQTDDLNGDVLARGLVRHREILTSLSILTNIANNINDNAPKPNTNSKLYPNTVSISFSEGFRGEICHVAITDEAGKLLRYKIVDPSFHNWNGLAYVVRNEGISDFPLCNKSFNLSYCGFDL